MSKHLFYPLHKGGAFLFLLVVIVLSLTLSVTWKQGLSIDTDLFSLLPSEERSLEQEAVLRKSSHQVAQSFTYLISAENFSDTAGALRVFHSSLTSQPLIGNVQGIFEKNPFHSLVEVSRPYLRGFFPDAAPHALSVAECKNYFNGLNRYLYGPEAGVFTSLLPFDPFLFFPRYLDELRRLTSSSLEIVDGVLSVIHEKKRYGVIRAEVQKSIFSTSTTDELIPFLLSVEHKVKEIYPTVTILRGGALWFSHEASITIRHESELVGTLTLIATTLVLWIFYRSWTALFFSLLPFCIGTVGALGGTILLFPSIHVVTLGFGTTLIGACTDYALHYLSACGINKKEKFLPLRRTFRGLTLGMCTSVAAYLSLFATPLPLLVQLAAFISFGLLFSYLTVVLWFPYLLVARGSLRSGAHRQLNRSRLIEGGITLGVGAGILSLLWYSHVDDTIQHTQKFSPSLYAQERLVHQALHLPDIRKMILVEGNNEGELLRRVELLTQGMKKLVQQGTVKGFLSLSSFIPSEENQKKSKELYQELTHCPEASSFLQESTFSEELLSLSKALSFEPFKEARTLFLDGGEKKYSLMLLQPPYSEESLSFLLKGSSGASLIDTTESINTTLGQYRMRGLLITGMSYIGIFLFLLWRYGRYRGALTILPPVAGALFSLGIGGALGIPLSVFTLFATLIVLGLAVDFSVFLGEDTSGGEETTEAVVISTLTTVMTFGGLAVCSSPLLYQIGFIVSVGVFTACLVALYIVAPRLIPSGR